MSQSNISNASDCSALLYIIVAILSAYFGHMVGRADKIDYLQEQQQQMEQKIIDKQQ